jgi:hypothetical protein
LLKDKGVPLERQCFTWKELVQPSYGKLDVDAMTRVRVIAMNAVEAEAVRFQHAFARASDVHRLALARVRRVEHHQQTMIHWLHPADQSALETAVALQQAAIEITASIGRNEPDPQIAQVFRFGLLQDLDHLYRYAALLDRVEGKDANALLQNYTDIVPGRPTALAHRHPDDELRRPYDRATAALATKLDALTIMALAQHARDYYVTVGPTYPDPLGRLLFAEIASVQEQHLTQYESIIDPREGWLEKWLLHEACEVYNYFCCVESEPNSRIRSIWERMLEYELGHLRFVAELFENTERRDAATVLGAQLPAPIEFAGHREVVRATLQSEVDLSATELDIVPPQRVPTESPSHAYRAHVNSDGSPSEGVAEGYAFTPGTELTRRPVSRPS